eukprot:Gregarina_sp_Poly_1__11228@NODE_924_length_5693_cov_245_721649_g657_i0_p4_GENE_NODE_924_length_5693_cov_245_721649_g657_i0NODE_924_length_5693_cov_245_721649_g657_i0_p4_ORF_typecomplete_len146_score9_76TMEM234/PF10639_9/2_6e25Defensin_big/PF14862_6/9_6e05Defensin_big/PF14862_6/1_1e03EamA/PF00892_20/0_076_NODE_924_length_5693_cov_245_721649_g657_i021382575
MDLVVSKSLLYALVGLLWGATTPFMKAAVVAEAASPKQRTRCVRGIEWLFGPGSSNMLKWQVLLPYGLNQIGSVLFMILLGTHEISKAVPIANSLASMFTFVTELFIFRKEVPDRCKVQSKKLCPSIDRGNVGMLLHFAGSILLC